MDGVSHYVTVRRDLYTGLVASPATTLPVATLAITETNNPVTEDNADNNSLSSSRGGGGKSIEQQQQRHHHNHPGSTSTQHHHTLAVQAATTTNTNLTELNNSGIHYDCNLCAKSYPSKALLTRHLRNQHQLLINPAAVGVTVTNSSCTNTSSSYNNTQSLCNTTTVAKTPSPPLNSEFKSSNSEYKSTTSNKHLKSIHQQHEVIVTTAATSNERSSPILNSASNNDIQQSSRGGGGMGSDSAGKRQPGEKRFQCGQCFKRFPTSKDLKRHDVVHTGNREFQCSFCSHRFGRKDHRMRHEKKTHAAELLNGGGSSSSTGSPISPKTDSNCSSNSSNNHTPVFGAKHHRLASASEELPRLGSHGGVHGVHHGSHNNAGSSSPIEKKRWRHVSSPSITSSDLDLDQFDSPIRLRAMSTSESSPYHYRGGGEGPRCNSVTGSELKYLENQLSPESLQESHSMSPDLNSVKEESEDTCLSHASEDTCKSDLDWIMSDFCMTAATSGGRTTSGGEDNSKVVESVLSPSPDSSSGLSPPVGFYTAPPIPTSVVVAPSENLRPNSSTEKLLAESNNSSTTAQQHPLPPPTLAIPTSATTNTTPPVLPAMPSLIPTTTTTRCPKQLMSDMLTRTKNPVLPSVYIDNSLIVPEPSKQKYHNPHPLLSPEDMDDYYEAFLDDKDITETLFHV